MHLDSIVNLFMQLLAALHIVRSEPAAYTFGLEVCIQPLGEDLVFAGVADKAGVELDRAVHGANEVNKNRRSRPRPSEKRLESCPVSVQGYQCRLSKGQSASPFPESWPG